jgi:hypothetical protein
MTKVAKVIIRALQVSPQTAARSGQLAPWRLPQASPKVRRTAGPDLLPEAPTPEIIQALQRSLLCREGKRRRRALAQPAR